MVVVDALLGDSAAAVAEVLGGGAADLQAFFDHGALEASGGEEGEEELEWLSNKDAFPTVETMAPSAPLPRTKGVRRRRWEAAPSPPQAPVVVRAPQAAEWRCRHCGTDSTPQRREGPEGRCTLCNACGVRYRSGRLVPEYRPASSPTFSPAFHSNRHRVVVELRRRREAEAPASLATAGNGEEKGNEHLGSLSKKGEVLTAAAGATRPRTKGMRRPRTALAWPLIAWSSPPPPCSPAVVGQRQSHGGGPGVAGERGHAPDGDDHGVRSSAVPADVGLNPAAPVAPAAEPGQRCQQFGTEKTLRWLEGPEWGSTLCNAGVVRCTSERMVQVQMPASSLTYSPELRFDWHNRVKLHRRLERSAKFSPTTAGVVEEGKEELEMPSNKDAFPAVQSMLLAWASPQTKNTRRRRRVVELSPPRTPLARRRRGGEAAVVEHGRVGDGGSAAAVEGRAEGPGAPLAPMVSGRQCRHCGTKKTPQWREGPEGRQTLCNACGVRFRSGRLVPEYRPASSPTFSPGLHSNVHRQVVQLRRREANRAEVSPAVAAAATLLQATSAGWFLLDD